MDTKDVQPESADWEPLGSLFGGYFHQDFRLIHGGAWEAVGAFMREADPPLVKDAAAAARRLSADLERESDVEAAVEKLGLEYHPPGDGYTYRGWVIELANFLESGSRS